MPTQAARALAAGALLLSLGAAAHAVDPSPELARAEAMLQEGRLDEALAALDKLIRRQPDHAEAHLLRSTARLLTGDMEAGSADLDRALALDPSLRRGWLNRAALDLADANYERALAALVEAEALDPGATDNHLNIGAVLALLDRLPEARQRFERYLALEPNAAQAHLLVGSNLALAGHAEEALSHLARAVDLDERMRVQARIDPNFAALAERSDFQELLSRDSYHPPPGAHTAERTYAAPFDHGRGRLLEAVLNALQSSGYTLDSKIEVTSSWALVWSRCRIKVSDEGGERGRVELSALPEAFDAESWRRESEALLGQIEIELLRISRSRTP